MGTFQFAGTRPGEASAPAIFQYLLANSLSGTGTPPANALQYGDPVVLTTATALTSGGAAVCRQLLAADKTAHYKEGTPVAGILGIAGNAVQTNASGVAIQPPPLGGVTTNAAIPYPLSGPAMQQTDVYTGRSYMNVYLFGGANIFEGQLYMGAGAITLGHQYDNTLGGITLTTTSGITKFTINTSDTGVDACILILGPNEQNPLYGTAVASGAAVGPTVFFTVLPSFQQFLTGVDYSTQ